MKVLCIVCRSYVLFEDATAGSLYADGSQAFACNHHITEHNGRWTMAWIAFDAEQRATATSAATKAVTK
jgi:hypothetical protein